MTDAQYRVLRGALNDLTGIKARLLEIERQLPADFLGGHQEVSNASVYVDDAISQLKQITRPDHPVTDVEPFEHYSKEPPRIVGRK